MPADKISAAEEASEQSLADIVKRAERAIQEGLDELRSRSRPYADAAGDHFETAQQYVTDRVQERPIASTFAALGVGVLIGFLLSGRKQ